MIEIFTYLLYILITSYITIYVGNLLYLDGGIWLSDLLGSFEWVGKMNNLLRIGYYLVNLGYVFYAINDWEVMNNWLTALIQLAEKIGMILLLLGYLHYQNIILISIFHNLNTQKKWKI